ncbi:hypothetical protein T552_00574 [Pneumocystis carinii B80]|uniref:Uncharacterized protein n=1 Tax=Pneumocystis carinii (strain B80) TaxID=1408658 RepID=A0A0W4ZR76_PNEC8|nr:hypothetical protein T552_00574 [Pneumocystis carinii B80]KTW30863.1 hypothetical protein T552_00574 [Pneumocystis carinii B80]
MFGVICAGRPIQTNIQQIENNKFIFVLENAASINHIIIFLLPENFFQEGFGATVYLQYPGKQFQLLGGLSNKKPSAIFRLKNASNSSNANTEMEEMQDVSESSQSIAAVLGISIEPLLSVEQQLSSLSMAQQDQKKLQKSEVSRPVPPIQTIVQRIITNLYNFIVGFTTSQLPHGSQLLGNAQMDNTFIPLKAFQDWHSKFSSKLSMDPHFLEKD